MPNSHEDPIPNHPLLARLGESMPEHVLRVRYADGELILKEGDPGEAIYFLEDGSLVVEQSTGTDSRPHILKILSNSLDSGQLLPFGEMSHLLDGRRSATIRSSGGSVVVQLANAAFEKIYKDYPDIARTLNLKLVERLREANARLRELASRMEPPVERVRLEGAKILVRQDQPVFDLWQCVAGTLLKVGAGGGRSEYDVDSEGFIDPLPFFLGTHGNVTVEAQSGAFLLRWTCSQPSEVFRFHPDLALRLLKSTKT